MPNTTLTAAREVVTGLRGLREHAPADLLIRTQAQLGLADAYVQVEGPIGPLFVAFGPDGISLVHRAGDAADAVDAGEFEEEFLATFGRPITRIAQPPEGIARVIEARVWGKSGAPRSASPANIALNLAWLPDFERQVLRKTLEIPR